MLTAGDIAFIGFNFDNPDAFSFVALTSISAGETIYFTDNGWTEDDRFRANEGTYTWAAQENIAAGTIVTLSDVGLYFSTSGDQILAYQGDASSPTFIAALNAQESSWQSDATSSSTSALPTGLSNGITAVAVGEIDNAVYTGITSGSKDALLAAINDASNWSGSNSTRQTMPTAVFSVTDATESLSFTYTQSFETEATSSSDYDDPTDGDVDHDLINIDGAPLVDSENSGTELNGTLAFDASFESTGDVGLLDGDFVGVTSYATAVGSYSDGTQGYQLSDSDGRYVLNFETVDVSQSDDVEVSLDLFVDGTTWETTDLIQIGADVDGAIQWLLDTSGSDINELNLEESWTTLSTVVDASAQEVTLFVNFEANAAAEAAYIDNIVITTEFDAPTGDDVGGDDDNDTDDIITLISEIQGITDYSDFTDLPTVGVDDVSAYEGQIVTVQAVVTADFQDGDADETNNMSGFYVQEEDGDSDGNDATSEGLFIYDGVLDTGVDVNVGDVVTITGTVSEYYGQTQLSATTIIVDATDAEMPSVTELSFGDFGVMYDDDGGYVIDLESYEGMQVNISTDMTVSELYQLDSYGEYVVTEGGRIATYAQDNTPDAEGYDLWLQDVASRSITLDDAQSGSYSDTVEVIDGNDGILGSDDSFNMGDTITNIEGVLGYTYDLFRVMDATGTYEDTNAVEDSPETFDGNLKVASLNVLNYFTTLNTDDNATDTGSDPRGANSEEELARQTTKVVNALIEMDADVVGLLEVENSENSETLAYLVEELNDALGSEVYGYINTGLVGDDAIANAVIYKIATVIPIGVTDILDSDTFLDPLATGGDLNRPAVNQSFLHVETGDSFTVSVNHLKSKGSLSGDAADEDQSDGAGNNNATRTAAAETLAQYLDTDPTGVSTGNVLVIGDLNSYAQEDPITALEEAGYNDLAYESLGQDAYSYVFDATTGTLDYIMGTDDMSDALSGITEWHINSDEADIFDYNIEVASNDGDYIYDTRDTSYFDADTALRGSDHDPVIATFALEQDLDVILDNDGVGVLRGTQGADRFIMIGGMDYVLGGEGDDSFVFHGSLANGETDTTILRDYEAGELLEGVLIDDVTVSYAAEGRVSLVVGEDGDQIMLFNVSNLDEIRFDGPF